MVGGGKLREHWRREREREEETLSGTHRYHLWSRRCAVGLRLARFHDR
jgi:hypothetical protein